MNEYLLCSLACLVGYIVGYRIKCKKLKDIANQAVCLAEESNLKLKALEVTIRTMKYVAEERANSIRSLNGWNSRYRKEIDILKTDLVNEKMRFDAYVSKQKEDVG
jgi:hypothetical protein